MDYENALKAVQELHGNKDYSLRECLENFNNLAGEVEIIISALEHDIEQDGG